MWHLLLYRYTETYQPFLYLLSKDADKFVDKFISRERPLTEYVKQIEKLKDMSSRVASLPVFVPMHLFLLDCTVLNQVPSLLPVPPETRDLISINTPIVPVFSG